ncbi:MAG: glycosyltransferase family 2 protein [Clostridia bacterium]|nr:glycosyltransferase family 2 protein [Clostridia bacterium]
MVRTAAVVVTHNRKALLEKCLAHLLKQSAVCDVLLVDNASTDGTGEWAQAFAASHERVHYRNTGANLGGAGGFSFGMRWAVEAGYSHVWIMDDDTLPEQDALARLLEADELLGGEYGFLSSVVLWTDGRECRMNRQKLKKAYYERVELLEHGVILAEQATFVSCLFRAEVIERAGLPIKEFFIWGDDIEYTRRLSVRMKLPCYLVGKSRVVHAMKENNGSSIAADMPRRISRYNYAFRNENYLYRQEGVRGFVFYTAKCALNLLRILRFARDHRLRRCTVIVKQYTLGLLFHPKIEYVTRKG